MSSSEWPVYRIKDIAGIHNAKRVPLSSRERENRQGSYPYYGASGIVDFIDDYIFDGEFVLISEDGENLRSRKTPIAFKANGKFWVNNHAHILRGKKDFVNDWIVYFFQNIDLNPYITGAVQPKLNRQNLELIEIPLPEDHKAKRITSILSALDEKIELNRQTNATLEAIAQAIFREWFVNFNYPVLHYDLDDYMRTMRVGGENHSESGNQTNHSTDMVEGEMGLMPAGWRVGNILEIATLLSGGTPSTRIEAYWNGELDWVSAKDVSNSNQTFILETDRKITQTGLDNSSTKLLPKLTTIITARGSVGNYAILSKPMTMNQTNYGLKAKFDEADYFVFFALGNLVSQLQKASYGTIFDTITTRTFEHSLLVLPPASLIQAFNKTISPIMEAMLRNLEESTTLAQIRDALLPKLMRGEIV